MISAFRNTIAYVLIVFGIIIVGLTGCENPGSVGRGIGDSKAKVEIDTFQVNNISAEGLDYYSGGFSHFSAGQFDDPLFGNINATGLLKPSLPSLSDDSLALDSKMLMRLIIDGENVYGDSLAEQTFDLYEVKEFWRSKAHRLGDQIELGDSPIASFSVKEDEDSLDVPLPSDWVHEYRGFANEGADSTYSNESFGLALVSSSAKKVIPLSTSKTSFVIQNTAEDDTISVGLSEWAYQLQRGNASISQNSLVLHSTNEQMLSFDLDLPSINLQGPDIAKAELVFYQNSDLLESSLNSETPTTQRPQPQAAQLHLIDTEQLPDNITPGSPIANGTYSEEDKGFHFEFTSQLQNLLANGMPNDRDFLITFTVDGIIKTSIIYTDQAAEENRPKLIITSLKNNSN